MIVALKCDKILLVQAEFDGELDAAEAAALAVHRQECAICQAAAAELTQARALIGDDLYQPVRDEFRQRIIAQLAAAASPRIPPSLGWRRRWWPSAAGFGIGAACAAGLTALMLTSAQIDLTEQIVAGHVRALQPGHLEDVASTDQHTVKPWFDGRIDFAPPVKDLVAERFALRGGRLDYIGGRPVATLVYQRDKHLIDLYVWPATDVERSPETMQRQGYNIVHWTRNGMALWAVSDLEPSQLREFVEAWRRSP
jgi:anti-sigma factor RsiW